MKRFFMSRQMLTLAATLSVWIILTLATYIINDAAPGQPGSFLTFHNVTNILIQVSITGVLAVSAVLVILSAGIDLSIGSLTTFTGLFFAIMISESNGIATSSLSILGAVVLSLSFAAAVGLINGIMVHDLKLPSFIATLSMMFILRSGALLITQGRDVADIPASVGDIGISYFLGIPTLFWPLIIIVVLTDCFLNFTRHGRHIYAIGSNPEAARSSGVNTRMTTYLVYMLASLLGAVAGCMITIRNNMASTTAGESMELEAIAAAILGGASLMGARGSAIGGFLGALMMTTIYNGATLMGINDNYTKVIIGLILIATVASGRLPSRTKS